MLVNSWFTNKEFLQFVTSRHIGCHLLGIIMRKWNAKYSKYYRFYYCEGQRTLLVHL